MATIHCQAIRSQHSNRHWCYDNAHRLNPHTEKPVTTTPDVLIRYEWDGEFEE